MPIAEITQLERVDPAGPGLSVSSSQLCEALYVPASSSEQEPAERTISIQIHGGTIRITGTEDGPTWLLPVIEEFVKVAALPENWDREGGLQIDPNLMNRALQTLDRLLSPGGAPPGVVPLSNGGLQLEWHRKGKDFEIEFNPNGEIEFYFFDEETSEEAEGAAENGLDQLEEYLGRVCLP